MSVCCKCSKSIKPASLAVAIKEDKYHPFCLTCDVCEQPIWGKPFTRNKNGSMQCDPPCVAKSKQANDQRPQAVARTASSMALKEQQQPAAATAAAAASINKDRGGSAKYPNQAKRAQQPTSATMVKSPSSTNQSVAAGTSALPRVHSAYKTCKICKQCVIHRRYITLESGEIVCQECDDKWRVQPLELNTPLTCRVCARELTDGCKYITEADGSSMCAACDEDSGGGATTAFQCAACKGIIRAEEPHARLQGDPRAPKLVRVHYRCFMCTSCGENIGSAEFFTDRETGYPHCEPCFRQNNSSATAPPQAVRCAKCQTELSAATQSSRDKSLCTKCDNAACAGAGAGPSRCAKCSKPLGEGSERVTHAPGVVFHSACFRCETCNVDLSKTPRRARSAASSRNANDAAASSSVYCETCLAKQSSPTCEKCREPILSYMPSAEHQGRAYHSACFVCSKCKRSLANRKVAAKKDGGALICDLCVA